MEGKKRKVSGGLFGRFQTPFFGHQYLCVLFNSRNEKPMEQPMTQRIVRHEVKLQKSVIIILGVLAFGVCANAFSSVFNVKEVSAGHRVGGTQLGSKYHPLIIECKKGC